MKTIHLLSAALLLGTMFGACKKNDSSSSGYSQSQLNYQLVAANTTTGIVQKTSASANISWSAGFANPRKIKFEAKQNNTEIELTSTNNTQIDIMSSVSASFGNFTIPAGTYKEIELQIFLEKDGNQPSLQLSGQFTNGTNTYPVVIQITDPLEIKTEQEDVVITDNTSFTAATTLDLSSFTQGITENMLLNAQLTNGTIVISNSSNKNMYHIVVNNITDRHFHCEFHHHH